MMQNPLPCGNSSRLHGPLHCMVAGADDEHEFEELDPSGRYGRYKDVLGKGAFKVVYKGFDIVDGIEVAWNQIKVQNALHSADDIDRFHSEVHLLKTLKHKNIIKFYHSWVDTEAMNINFLTEIFTSGTLRQYRKRHKRIDIRAVKKWSRQILRGLLYLHSQDPPIIHRDLKCDNIFINGNQGEVKIGDLGLATILNQAHAAQSVIGTPEFMAPELYEEAYTELVDIYSFGMCLLEMVTNDYPYSECLTAAQIYKKVTSGKNPAALTKIKSPQLRQFVEKCIAPASKRLPARELLMDPFLQEDEVYDIVGDTCSSHKPAYNLRSVKGSYSDIQTSFRDQTLGNSVSFSRVDSFSSLLDVYRGNMLNSPITSRLHHRPVPNQDDSQILWSIDDKLGRKMGFQIKGKKMEDDILQLRLRIAHKEDDVRIIHFHFDVLYDTASSVAAEMIAELGLINYDVTKLAEMIDDAIQIMVPSWQKGRTTPKAAYGIQNHDVVNGYQYLSAMSSKNFKAEQSEALNLPSQSCEHPLAAPKHSQMETTMHGRFEEIAYHPNAAERVQVTGDDSGTVMGTSSEESWDSSCFLSPLSSISRRGDRDSNFSGNSCLSG